MDEIGKEDAQLLRQLRVLAVERRPEACLGCGLEHNCSTRGCAVIVEAWRRARECEAVKNALDDAEGKLNVETCKIEERIAVWKQMLALAATDAKREKCKSMIFAYTECLQGLDAVGAACDRAAAALKEKE